jgi:hypothetical protein
MSVLDCSRISVSRNSCGVRCVRFSPLGVLTLLSGYQTAIPLTAGVLSSVYIPVHKLC